MTPNTSLYQQHKQQAKDAPEQFWGEQANKLAWYQKPTSILKKLDQHHYQWFSDGVMNTCYMALDHQIEQGRGNQTALIYDSPVTGQTKKYSYLQLWDQVALFAGVLKANGLEKGDRVVIYMPMIPEAAIAMLAVARCNTKTHYQRFLWRRN